MLLYPISPTNNNIYESSFHGKHVDVERIFSSKKIKEELNNIKTNKDAKNIFLGLSVLAGSVLAELTNFAEKTEIKEFANTILNNLGLNDNSKLQKEMTDLFSAILKDKSDGDSTDYSSLIKENPNRERYLKVFAQFPKLDKKYRQLLKKAVQEPDNKDNLITLNTLDIAFECLTKEDKIQYYESYLDALDTKFSDRLDDVAKNILSAFRGGDNPLTYLRMLESGVLSPDDVSLWAKAKYLESSEFIVCKYLDDNILINLSELKSKNNKFKITFMKPFDNYYYKNLYSFKLKIKENMPLEEKLKIMKDVHTAIYGPIFLNDEPDITSKFIHTDIRTELIDNILKDRQIDSVFNFVKFINPKALQDFDLTGHDIKFLSQESDTYKQIKSICSKEVMNIDMTNPRLIELYSIIQNENIFGNLFTTTHARLRFITRIVLKDNPNPKNLAYLCKSKIETLKKELDKNFNKLYFMCYTNKKGYAPQFYNYESKLGNYIKITLNSSGNIHTIYEDFLKEKKQKV